MLTQIKSSIAFGFLLVFLVISSFAYYGYQINKETSTRIASLEKQIQVISKTLQNQATVSASDKRQLQELINRSAVIANAEDTSLTTAVAKVTPAVVSIVVSKDVQQYEVQYRNPFGDDPFFQGVGIQIPVYVPTGSTTRQKVAAGTGFIIRSDGYIITNRHVVSDTSAYYTVLLSNGSQKQAQVIYRDETYDLAILKIGNGSYTSVTLGDSSQLKLGQSVAAIGNALGEYNNSVSVGVISGLDRSIDAQSENGTVEKLTHVIQTDAAINPGNSGGPLLNLSGKVIGVNVATVGGANNIGFALPVNEVKSVIAKVLR